MPTSRSFGKQLLLQHLVLVSIPTSTVFTHALTLSGLACNFSTVCMHQRQVAYITFGAEIIPIEILHAIAMNAIVYRFLIK